MDNPLNKKAFWAYATMFGTLWGGLELTLGTFLHVLHVPKTGLIMTAIASILLVAQRVIYPRRGLTLAAGIIASCIKCLSPGGIILGPVIGIMSMALLIEIALLPSSRHSATACIAGILAVISSQCQSLFKLWVIYGKDFFTAIIKLAEKFFNTEWSTALGLSIIGALIGILCLIGGFSGITGWIWGKRVLRRISNKSSETEVQNQLSSITPSPTRPANATTPFIPKSKRNPEDIAQVIATRKIVAIFAIASLASQFILIFGLDYKDSLFTISIAAGIWFTSLIVFARPVLKAIWWPKFWLLTVIVSLFAGVILAWEFGKSLDLLVAAEATARMIIRGAYAFSLITWFTRCVRTSEFHKLCRKLHIPQLSTALTQAYELLPNWVDRFNELLKTRPKGVINSWKYLKESAIDVLQEAAERAESNYNNEVPASK